MRDRNLLLL